NLVWWFKQRLLLAVKTRLKRYPDNPLWVLPNGVYRDVRTPTPQEWSDFGKLLQAVYSPVRPGRPKGSGFHHDAKDFLSKVLPVMCDLIRKGRQPTQENVAPYLNTTDRQIRECVMGFHLVCDDLRQRAKETRQII